jgi:hypothetical protein
MGCDVPIVQGDAGFFVPTPHGFRVVWHRGCLMRHLFNDPVLFPSTMILDEESSSWSCRPIDHQTVLRPPVVLVDTLPPGISDPNTGGVVLPSFIPSDE